MFECPLTNDLTQKQRSAGLWVGEDDHCLYLMKGYEPAEIVACFNLNGTIEAVLEEAEAVLQQELPVRQNENSVAGLVL